MCIPPCSPVPVPQLLQGALTCKYQDKLFIFCSLARQQCASTKAVMCTSLLRTWVQAQRLFSAARCKVHCQNKVILVAPVLVLLGAYQDSFDKPAFPLRLPGYPGNGCETGGENTRPTAACSCCALQLLDGYRELKTWAISLSAEKGCGQHTAEPSVQAPEDTLSRSSAK